ncbi:tetratricopeptide repeat protein [Thermosulfurimonas sp. F29]|uniref:tetratricopeptide repeat protein n=1 Tax=Thermosulfurimonas sp. F29 TaxID=2867247 RepID=UPI001C836243|nr:tetratricopeptide repeat protein [Thermosulfurimonas sp. F29]MBX6422088.1 tetratricopeptide repeat protein [Thermosulfurimonas sp. F29]
MIRKEAMEEHLHPEVQEALKWYQEARVMWAQGRSLDALSRYEEAYRVFVKHRRHREAANAAEKMGDIYFNRGNFQKALKPYRIALDICEEYEDELGAAILSEKIVYVYKELREPEKALPYLYRALEIAEKYKDAHRAARMLAGIGDVYRGQGRHQAALEAYELAARIYRRIGSREQARLVEEALKTLREEVGAGELPPNHPDEGNP